MKRDLDCIYEDIVQRRDFYPHGYDPFFDEKLNETKLNYFFDHFISANMLFELFDKDGSDVVINFSENTLQDGSIEYKFENIINDKKYYTIITLTKNKKYLNKLEYDIMDRLRVGADVTELNDIKNILESRPNQFVMSFRFIDENELTYLTKEAGNKSILIFSVVYRNIRQVYRKHPSDISVSNCLIAKTEHKRLDLYKHIINKTANPKHLYIDEYSLPQYYILYFWGFKNI
jgi:hypothetical protein